jgi:hypothetical protein
MLSIIPKEVLATLGNIHKLLDIGQNFTKQNKNNVNNAVKANQNNTNNNTPNDKVNESDTDNAEK